MSYLTRNRTNMNICTILICILVLFTTRVDGRRVSKFEKHVSDHGFSYRNNSPVGPENWYKINKNCRGKLQSPINIDTSATILVNTKKYFSCTKWDEIPEKIVVKNTGHYIQFNFYYKKGEKPRLIPYPITDQVYEMDSAHVHFIGTEHTLNNNRNIFKMEGHVVFYKKSYGNLEKAKKFKDGIIVITKFYKSNFEKQMNFSVFAKVRKPTKTYTLVSTYPLNNNFGEIKFDFYTYLGSLTTPGCDQAVRFIIDDSFLFVDDSVIRDLGKIRGNDGFMSPNIRPLQKLNKRKVYHYQNMSPRLRTSNIDYGKTAFTGI